MRLQLLAVLAFAVSKTVAGQSIKPPEIIAKLPLFKYYIGASAAVQSYQVVSPVGSIKFLGKEAVYPLYLYAGYQLAPHLAVQAGFCQHSPVDVNYEDVGVLPDGRTYEGYDRRRQYDAALPVLLRYRLSRKLNHRFHVDALLGVTTQFHRYRREIMTKVDGQITENFYQNDRNTNFYLTGNLALGLTIGRHVDVTAEAGANTNIETLRYAEVRQFTPALACGIRYGFGKPQPASPF